MIKNSVGITQHVRRAIEDHARQERPAECCGLLSGIDGLITDLHPLRNTSAEPRRRYFAAPEELFSTMRSIRESGRRLMGIYHSHPQSAAYPSAADVEMAFYPDALYFIMSLEPRIDLKAFRIVDSTVEDVSVSISG